MPRAVCYIELEVGGSLPLQFVKIAKNSLLGVAECFCINRARLYRMLVHHFFCFLYMLCKIVFYREICNKHLCLHRRVLHIVPIGLLRGGDTGEGAVLEGERRTTIKRTVPRRRIFQTEFPVRLWQRTFAAGCQNGE